MLLLMIFVVCLTFYLAVWYKTIKEHYENNSIIVEVVSQIEEESISSYLLDNPNTIIYLASSNDSEVKSFEKKLKKYITDKNLSDEIVYFDTIDLDKEKINNIFLGYIGAELKNLKNINVPNMLYFENGQIADILYFKDKVITKKDTMEFLERNNVVVDD